MMSEAAGGHDAGGGGRSGARVRADEGGKELAAEDRHTTRGSHPGERAPAPASESASASASHDAPPAPHSAPLPGRILAIDYGERRIGLALSDPTRTIASPAGFVVRRAGKRPPLAELARRAAEHDATAIVLGLPLDEYGNDTPRAAEVRRIAPTLEERTGLPVSLVDERYTTAAALRAVRDMGGSTRGRKGDVDALAATILLQHALRLSR